MTDLDSKLREILKSASISGKYGDTHEATYRELTAQLKAAFADDVKEKLVSGSIHGVGVYEVNHQSKTIAEIVNENLADIKKVHHLMTGAEWYARFWHEYDQPEGRGPQVADSTIVREQVDKIARRAAGIQSDPEREGGEV